MSSDNDILKKCLSGKVSAVNNGGSISRKGA